MSATAAGNPNDKLNPISEVDDVNMFQAARRNGRRNALGDVGEVLVQGKIHRLLTHRSSKLFSLGNPSIASAEVDQMMPNFQSMSLKQ